MGLRVGPFFHIYLHGRQSTPPASSVANNDRQAIEVIRSVRFIWNFNCY